MAEADQIDTRSGTATRPSLRRLPPSHALKATVEPSVSVAPRLVPRLAEHFETLTHADLVYEVNVVEPAGEPYTP